MCSSLESMKNELELLEGQLQDEAGQPGSCDDKVYYGSAPTFLDLPVELFLKICTFLDADFISGILAKVCRRFEFILDDTTLWKTWACERMRGTYPALPHLKIWEELEVDWRSACSEVDSECNKWSDAKNRMRHIVIKDVHFASVDTVLLVKNGQICISGGRDRGLAMWNVLAVEPNHQGGSTNTTIASAKPEHMHHDAHSGWVWDLAADHPENSRVVYSASWDNTVKAWDLDSGLSCIHTFQCGMSALSLTTSDNIVMAGLYSKKVLSFDIRVGTDPIATYKPHRGPVLALEHFENKIASVSEDRTLAVWDRVAGKLITSDVKLPSEKAYPVCISWNHSALYVGDSKGSLHLLDPEELVYLKSHRVWPEPVSTQPCYKITGCVQTLASLIVCSDRGEVKFLYNAYPPRTYTTVKTTTLDITQLRYQNDVMVLGTCDSALEFWVPNEMYENLNNHL